jgi:hypothetical protein
MSGVAGSISIRLASAICGVISTTTSTPFAFRIARCFSKRPRFVLFAHPIVVPANGRRSPTSSAGHTSDQARYPGVKQGLGERGPATTGTPLRH